MAATRLEDTLKGALRIYNQFPRCYQNIEEMTDQLPKIADMGFNAVWVNPICRTGNSAFKKFGERVKGSLYAIANPFKLNASLLFDHDEDHQNQKKLLKNYTDQAKELGLIPMFDLVLNHFAADSLFLKRKNCKLMSVDGFERDFNTEKWFKAFENKPRIEGLGADVIEFAYENNNVIDETIEYLWRPFIRTYILEYGFAGVRVDAARVLDSSLQTQLYEYIQQLCDGQAIIFAEVLFNDGRVEDVAGRLKGLGITHVTNSYYWACCDRDGRKEGDWKASIKPDEVAIIRSIAHENVRDNGSLAYGTIGFSGNHDAWTTAGAVIEKFTATHLGRAPRPVFKKQLQKNTNENIQRIQARDDIGLDIIKAMKEKMAFIAFTSDAGWYLLCGDEFGCLDNKSVFDHYHTTMNDWVRLQDCDWSGFITEINGVLATLPITTQPTHIEHVVLNSDDFADLMIIIRRTEDNLDSETHLVLINYGTTDMVLHDAQLNEIAREYANIFPRHPQIAQNAIKGLQPQQVHHVGQITLNWQLTQGVEEGKSASVSPASSNAGVEDEGTSAQRALSPRGDTEEQAQLLQAILASRREMSTDDGSGSARCDDINLSAA